MKHLLRICAVLLISAILTSCSNENKSVAEITLYGYQHNTSISSNKGKLILVSFGYTHCPDICPTTLMHVSEALDQLTKQEQASLATLFISLDPERDKLEKLDKYVKYFHPAIKGLHLNKKDEPLFLKAFNVEWFKDSDSPDYLINHTSFLYLVNDRAEILDMMSHQTKSEDIVKAIRKRLTM